MAFSVYFLLNLLLLMTVSPKGGSSLQQKICWFQGQPFAWGITLPTELERGWKQLQIHKAHIPTVLTQCEVVFMNKHFQKPLIKISYNCVQWYLFEG